MDQTVADSATHPADRLLAAIDRLGAPVCVGLDPVIDRLPRELSRAEPLAAIHTFCLGVLDAISGIAPCVKLQSACFERYRGRGFDLMFELIAAGHQRGMQVILDWKRGDIGISAEHYAAAAFGAGPETAPDWITASGYLGLETIQPYLDRGGGVFVLVRTSNPGSDQIQAVGPNEDRSVAHVMAGCVHAAGVNHLGSSGYSAVGAVVGATKSDEIQTLRSHMPEQLFLVPGYGAQGGSAADVVSAFNADGRGAIITASRSVIYAFDQQADWRPSVREAARRFADDIVGVVTT